MTLIKSISGMRGTIGGAPSDNLTPIDITEFASAFAQWLKSAHAKPKIVIGRDGRISGHSVQQIITHTLLMCGVDVVDTDLSTTPTVEMAVVYHQAHGGIIVTASHNPKQWNALKFLNSKGEFISAEIGGQLLRAIKDRQFHFAGIEDLGQLIEDRASIQRHIGAILELPYINSKMIANRNFRVVVDAINSTGAISIPPLLQALGCQVSIINANISGDFAHNPEPRPDHLSELCTRVVESGSDLGIAVDPDVDRLAFVDENGVFIGEEYTLVAAADFILRIKSGPTVSNLSSSRALTDISNLHGQTHFQSAVGEVNVVHKMKEVGAVIGGEGNGGVILPDLHYGRDALAGIALVLQHLVNQNKSLSQLRSSYQDYFMSKDKVSLSPEIDLEKILNEMQVQYKEEDCSSIDGLKISFDDHWVHMRKSNTEPIIRVYAEAPNEDQAKSLTERFKKELLSKVIE